MTTSTRSIQALDTDISRRWRSYSAEQRMVRDIALDEQGQPLPFDSAANASTYRKLDEAGRTLVWAVEVGGGELQRSDYRRDQHGNVVSYRQARTASRDLGTPAPEEPSAAYDFVNHYESSGLLQKHNRADSSSSISYAHDESGRCALIIDDASVEQREYDSNGRLSSQAIDPLVSQAAADLVGKPSSSVTTHRYDDQGRPIAIEQDGGGAAALPIDGQPDIQTLWRYAQDGSWEVEHIDFTSDTPNDSVARNGETASALRRIESWSRGCEGVQAAIPAPASNACSAD